MIRPDLIDYLKQQSPTPTGMSRFAPTGFYGDSPCVCSPLCCDDCDGEQCGCGACAALAVDEGLVRV
jgi:hypothetical protein